MEKDISHSFKEKKFLLIDDLIKGALSGLRPLLATEIPLKMLFSFSRYLNFCLDFLDM